MSERALTIRLPSCVTLSVCSILFLAGQATEAPASRVGSGSSAQASAAAVRKCPELQVQSDATIAGVKFSAGTYSILASGVACSRATSYLRTWFDSGQVSRGWSTRLLSQDRRRFTRVGSKVYLQATPASASSPGGLPKTCKLGPGATCDGVTLVGVSLAGRDLSGASFRFANFKGADLSRTNFTRAKLFGATLEEAKLGGANFNGADLSFARMKGASATGATFEGATLDFTVLPDGSTADSWCVIYQTCK